MNKNFLRGELTHENKMNVGINYAKIQKGKLLSKLFSAEDSLMKQAEQIFKREARATAQRNDYLLYRINKKK